jgi:hypothetical protein
MSTVASPDNITTDDVATPFTWRDVVRHTWWTYVGFVLLVFVVSVIAALPGEEPAFSPGTKLGIAAMLFVGGAIVGLIAVWVFSPFAWLLGKALEPVKRKLIHVLAFGLQGAVVFAVVTLFDRADPPLVGQLSLENPVALTLLLASAGTCAFGRWMAFRGRQRVRSAVAVPAGAPGSLTGSL